MEELLTERQETLQALKKKIARSQEAMAEFANRHRRDIEFNVGDRVLLKLQPYRQLSVSKPLSNKLARRYFGPYEIIERVGKVAYRLRLPADSIIHNVFHVSLLKKFVPFISATLDLPATFRRSDPFDTPISASGSRIVLVDGVPQEQWSVGWSSDGGAVPTWESAALLKEHFPDLHLEDKVASVDGGVDRNPAPEGPTPNVEQPEGHTNKPSNKTKSTKKPVQPRDERPKRNAPRPSKYKDFVSR